MLTEVLSKELALETTDGCHLWNEGEAGMGKASCEKRAWKAEIRSDLLSTVGLLLAPAPAH